MMQIPTISVAMATFNGARYLRQQLDSIASQTSPPDEIVIIDDGSIDNTVAIIESFAARVPFPVRLTRNEHRLGYGENFFRAASQCRSDWISFCDQDDVWFSEKLVRVRHAIKQGPPDLKLVVHQAEFTDGSLVPVGRRLIDHIDREVVPRRGHKCLWVAYGNTLTVSSHLVHELDWSSRPIDRFFASQKMSHDTWISVLANALGATRFIAAPCILYRRHEEALTISFSRPKKSQILLESRLSRGHRFFQGALFRLEIAEHLEKLAEHSPARYRRGLKEHAQDFRQGSNVLRNRAALELERQLGRRATALFQNIRVGAYLHTNNFGFSLRSLALDVAKLCRVL